MSLTIVGGGAAGLTAAYFAAKHGTRVTVLERSSEAGKKILVSGGTRCNVLPVIIDPETDYFTEGNNAAVLEVFRSWDLESCRSWIQDDLGVKLIQEKSSNKYFPMSHSSKEVRDALLRSCLDLGVKVHYSASVTKLKSSSSSNEGGWFCTTTDKRVFEADKIILASGGKSYPKLGTDGTGFEMLKKLGHTLHEPYPALTPLIGPHPDNAQLSGVTLSEVEVTVEGAQAQKSRYFSPRSGFLFTHRGYSGPAIMDVSHFVAKEDKESVPRILVNWINEDGQFWKTKLLERNWKGTVVNYIQRFGIPQRLALALCNLALIPDGKPLAQLTKKERVKLIQLLTAFPIGWTGHGGYKLAEVTGGGIPFNEVNCKTMESKVANGVYICGELMDVFGRIGGFNFYWAWISGRLAGIGASIRSEN
eukprot:g4609.t1